MTSTGTKPDQCCALTLRQNHIYHYGIPFLNVSCDQGTEIALPISVCARISNRWHIVASKLASELYDALQCFHDSYIGVYWQLEQPSILFD